MSAPPDSTQSATSGEGLQDSTGNGATMADSDSTPQASLKEKDKKDGKRRFFGLGKRKESAENTPTKSNSTVTTPTSTNPPVLPPPVTSTPLEIPRPAPRSPPQAGQGHNLSAAASPARSSRYRSSSPRLHSPASSQIFERNVQESNTIPDDSSLHIPSHIQTEDHIPAVLEASSLALTDDHLGPDEVEIVMHSAHLPAAEKVASGGAGTLTPGASDPGALSPIQGLSPIEDFGLNLHQSLENTQAQVASQFPPTASPSIGTHTQGGDDAASSYGALDTTDVRRLSFISFADVVQSEHVESSRDSAMHMSLSLSGSTANRSPSPVRSPASANSGMGTSPPTSGAPSMKGLDIGAATAATQKGRAVPGSPTSGTGGVHSPREGGGEIVVETMRHAMEEAGGGELVPRSALEREGGEEGVLR